MWRSTLFLVFPDLCRLGGLKDGEDWPEEVPGVELEGSLSAVASRTFEFCSPGRSDGLIACTSLVSPHGHSGDSTWLCSHFLLHRPSPKHCRGLAHAAFPVLGEQRGSLAPSLT